MANGMIRDLYPQERFLTVDHRRQIFVCLNRMLIEQDAKNFSFEGGERDAVLEKSMADLISRLNAILEDRKVEFSIQKKEDLSSGLREFQSIIQEVGPADLTFINYRLQALLVGGLN